MKYWRKKLSNKPPALLEKDWNYVLRILFVGATLRVTVTAETV
jgi:hypothetical protein